jgi:hypothetical protein
VEVKALGASRGQWYPSPREEAVITIRDRLMDSKMGRGMVSGVAYVKVDR